MAIVVVVVVDVVLAPFYVGPA